ncbi:MULTISPECIES: hypothetical protein [Bartonella]|uniref:Uncharacterized protein n=1 Tax=Bartonella choladocola TaxID=2750995 RepID=A0A1U9MGS7_9HYPH|nr:MULTISPECIES: hypothetical protein [Bartonella]AQT47167.1 hypothetical protein BBC0122_010460 [Bartonella choladocola]MBH9975336.1 hypothetical protein [Bartonella choladocola]MBI0014943.1 hypothetical protein [Bartonella sp. B10834G3]MBI0140518.1 hypothetical protein [Bartonella choladocola]
MALESRLTDNHIINAIADTGSLVILICLFGDRDNQTNRRSEGGQLLCVK